MAASPVGPPGPTRSLGGSGERVVEERGEGPWPSAADTRPRALRASLAQLALSCRRRRLTGRRASSARTNGLPSASRHPGHWLMVRPRRLR